MIKKISKIFWNWVLGLSTVDEKIIETVEETKRRSKRIKEEVKDVIKATKEVGNQISDIPDAIRGKKRKGRKSSK
jgi:chromosome segregation ATPase